MSRLTERQAAFAANVVAGMSGAQAAREAGYAEKYADRQAHQLLENPRVQAHIEKLRSKIDRGKIADATEVRETLTRILRQQVTEDTIAGKDPVRFETRPNAASIIRAAKTLGDLEGWFDHTGAEDAGQTDAIARALANPVRPDVN